MREQTLLDRLADDDHAAGEIHVFLRRYFVRSRGSKLFAVEKTLVRPGESQTGRRLQAVVNRLALAIEGLQANLPRDPFHQCRVAQALRDK